MYSFLISYQEQLNFYKSRLKTSILQELERFQILFFIFCHLTWLTLGNPAKRVKLEEVEEVEPEDPLNIKMETNTTLVRGKTHSTYELFSSLFCKRYQTNELKNF